MACPLKSGRYLVGGLPGIQELRADCCQDEANRNNGRVHAACRGSAMDPECRSPSGCSIRDRRSRARAPYPQGVVDPIGYALRPNTVGERDHGRSLHYLQRDRHIALVD
jgi:hypothetical protein